MSPTKESQEMEEKKCPINLRLLPIKAHYFFFIGGMGGVMPFLPVMAKGLGINATAVGLVFTMVPFCVLFAKPLFGFVTDYFKNIKRVVFVLVCVTSVSYVSTIFIPAVEYGLWTSVGIQCDARRDGFQLFPSNPTVRKCLKGAALKQDIACELSYVCGDNGKKAFLLGTLSTDRSAVGDEATFRHSNSTVTFPPDDFVVDAAGNVSSSEESLSRSTLRFQPDGDLNCDCASANTFLLRGVGPVINSCFASLPESYVYKTYQFWLFSLFAVVAGTGAATVFCLSDAACYEVLADRPELYGRQRLWGTISWGCVTLLAGLLNDIATGDSETPSYNPGFYVMVGLVVVDIALLLKIRLAKTNFSLNICQDVGKIFASCESVTFAAAVYISGALTGLLWNYQFWYLQDLGASQTLLGLTVAVQCIVAEVPFFFFAGWFIRKLGYFYCLSCVFAAFALRFGLYCMLVDPWFVLPIEVLHGVTFAVFYSSMTGYASNFAPPGTEATMMGILGGLYEGLGVATGSLLGGVGFDKLGGRNTFFAAMVISLICAPAFTLVHVVIKRLVGSGRTQNR